MRRGLLSLVLGALVSLGCEPALEEGLVVNLQSDYVAGVEFTSIDVSVDDEDPREIAVSSRDSFARPRPVTTFSGLPPGHHTVTVELVRGTVAVAMRRVQVELAGSRLVTIIVSRACGGVTCAPGETCSGGRCVSPSCIDGTEPTCPPPGCRSDTDCASSTECVVPTCVASVCLETPHDDRCGTDELCVPGMGCVGRPVEPDAGPRDAGSLDAPTPSGCSSTADCGGGQTCCDDRVCRASCVSGPCTGRAAGAVCREAAGPCDDEERCNGSDPDCPADAVDTTGRRCRNARGPCDEPEHCDGRAQCPRDVVAAAGAECRRAEGACDEAEGCDGSSIDCPPDRLAAAGVECRGAGGECGLSEACTGDSPHCPPDAHRPSGFVCRWGTSACDETESCSGGGGDCPPDGHRPNGEYCDERCGGEYCESGSCVGGTDCSGGQFCNGDSYCDYF